MSVRVRISADPWSLDGMSRLRRAIEITLPAKDLGSVGRVRDCTGSGPLVTSLSLRARTALPGGKLASLTGYKLL